MIEITDAAIERLKKAIKAEGENLEQAYLRLYMSAG